LCACQAIEFRHPLKSSSLLEFAHDYVRNFVGFAEEDRIFADDIAAIKKIICDFSFVKNINDFASSKAIELNKGFEQFVL
jgi:histidine ammonia-lyase